VPWALGERVRRIAVGVSFLAVFLEVILVVAGCGGGGNGTNISSISITPTAVSVPINTQTEFTATVNLANSTTTTTTTVTWEVNGTIGGSSSVGTIVNSVSDSEVGTYTAPTVVPSTNNGEVSITAVIQSGSSCTTTTTTTTTTTSNCTTITSNTATLTVTAGLGLAVTPTAAVVPAGSNFQFSALLNGLADPTATWSLSSTSGSTAATLGTIGPNGLYTAPPNPPIGGTVTVTANDPNATTAATATVTIVFSDHSLDGPYAFSYRGNDQNGFLAVAGSFVADGKGNIASGVEDVNSSLTGVATELPITGGTYTVGTDGRGTITLTAGSGTNTLAFALATSQHAYVTRFDRNVSGSGDIDQQSLTYLTNQLSIITGPYVFKAFGADASRAPMGIAGEFSANGSGTVPLTDTILDVNDDGTVTRSDTSLHGSYAMDSNFPDTGRGTLTLTSTTTGQLQFAFYIIDNPTANQPQVGRFRLVEIDSNTKPSLAGDMLTAPTGNSFTSANLAAGNYAFTYGGNIGTAGYASGGVFTSNGTGNVTGGVVDVNNAGTAQLDTSITSCSYTVDPTTGRIDLQLCTSGSTTEFAVYQSALGSAEMLRLDSGADAAGMAYTQSSLAAFSTGGLGLGLAGQGIFHNAPSSYPQETDGQLTVSGTSITAGNLDINNFSATFQGDLLVTASSSIGSPDSTYGRGTLVLVGSEPSVTYTLIYYLIGTNNALLFDQDSSRIAIGALARQF
jgi:hypothetical protein